jgi:hypothetical protein
LLLVSQWHFHNMKVGASRACVNAIPLPPLLASQSP